MTTIEKIEAHQSGKEMTDVWMVGEHLKDILQMDPSLEEIIEKDLELTEMGLEACAKKIKAYADEQQKKSKAKCVCVPPNVAEKIIREFYGLPLIGAESMEQAPAVSSAALPEEDALDFSDFL